jgi:DNA invertase Pin-like site-specific DNA recombinase
MGDIIMPRTLAYLRVSTLKQDIENQTHEINSYCTRNQISVDEWIKVEQSSRRTKKQRRIDELLTKLKRNDTLIVSELSRLGRSLSEVVLLVERLVQMKVRLVAIKQNIVLNGKPDPVTKAMIGLFSIFGEMERDMISVRTKNGLAHAKARGVKLGNPNLQRDNKVKQERAQNFAESLRTTLEGYVAQGMTQRAIVDELNNIGIKTRRGGRWSLIQLQNVLKRLELKTQRSR